MELDFSGDGAPEITFDTPFSQGSAAHPATLPFTLGGVDFGVLQTQQLDLGGLLLVARER